MDNMELKWILNTIQSVLRSSGISFTPVEMQLKDLVIFWQISTAENTNTGTRCGHIKLHCVSIIFQCTVRHSVSSRSVIMLIVIGHNSDSDLFISSHGHWSSLSSGSDASGHDINRGLSHTIAVLII